MVNAKMDVRLVWIYSSGNLHYTNVEIAKWRGEVLRELLKGLDESPGLSIEQIASELVGLTDERCAKMLCDAHVYVDIVENAREYANIVTR